MPTRTDRETAGLQRSGAGDKRTAHRQPCRLLLSRRFWTGLTTSTTRFNWPQPSWHHVETYPLTISVCVFIELIFLLPR